METLEDIFSINENNYKYNRSKLASLSTLFMVLPTATIVTGLKKYDSVVNYGASVDFESYSGLGIAGIASLASLGLGIYCLKKCFEKENISKEEKVENLFRK